MIVAHRGASAAAPENTFAAFELAWEQGADGVECDVRLTADGQLVCCHDAGTARTGDRALTVADSPWGELQGVDVGQWRGQAWHGERIPLLVDVLDRLPAGGRLFVEIKAGPACVPPLTQAVASHAAAPRIAILAFDAEVVAAVRQSLPELEALWLVERSKHTAAPRWAPSPEQLVRTAHACGATGLDVAVAGLTEDLVAACRDAGLSLHAWTVNDADTVRACARLGVQSITTDDPVRMAVAVEECIDPADD